MRSVCVPTDTNWRSPTRLAKSDLIPPPTQYCSHLYKQVKLSKPLLKEDYFKMPRTSQRNFGSALGQLEKQARGLLTGLRTQIRTTEAELARLRKEESKLLGLSGQARNGGPAAARGPARKGRRIDWSAVLKQMPKQFKASNVRGVRGLKDKRSSEIFAAIIRWIDAGTVKRRERGVYERIKA